MMNNRDKMDDLFREGLDGYRVEPSSDLWGKIEKRFFPARGITRNILITTILIMLLAGSYIVYRLALPALPVTPSAADSLVSALSEPAELVPTPVPATPPLETAQSDETVPLHSRTPSIVVPEQDQRPSVIQTTSEDAARDALDQAFLKQGFDQEIVGQPFQEEAMYSLADISLAMRTGLIEPSYIPVIHDPAPKPISVKLPISNTLKNEYARKYELHAGATFMPAVVYYDPNPNNTGWSAAFDLTYSRSSLNIYSGIGLSRFKDKGSWQVHYESYDSIGYYNNVTSFRISPEDPGNVIFETETETIYDSVPHISIAEKTNRYTYIDIPAGIGWNVIHSRRFSLTVRTGVKFSFLVHKEEPTADIKIPDMSEMTIIREVPPRMNATWRFMAGLELSYLLTGRLSLKLEPAYEQYLRSVYMSTGDYNARKPYLIGVNVGVRYRIK